MIHDPLLRIDILREKARKGEQVSVADWDAVRNDMNCAVCFFMRLKERGALKAHKQIADEIELFLVSREYLPLEPNSVLDRFDPPNTREIGHQGGEGE